MTFSIIIPAYNAEDYLSRCLESIFSQEFEDYEVIVINDGSTDGTAAILEQYAAKHPNLQMLIQSNQGMATARNRGLEVAQGEYILFVDSDDRLCPNALAALAPHLGGEDIIGFGARIFHETAGASAGGSSTGAATQDKATDTADASEASAVLTGWEYFCRERLMPRPVHFVCIWQRAYRHAFLEENNLRFIEGLRRGEDDLFTTMAFLHAQSVKALADCLYIYHVRATSITRSSDPKLDADSWHVQQILADTFIPIQGIDKRVIYLVLASNYINHLSVKGNTLTPTEWGQFRQVCVTPRHHRLYRICRISPSLLRFYNRLCSLPR